VKFSCWTVAQSGPLEPGASLLELSAERLPLKIWVFSVGVPSFSRMTTRQPTTQVGL
jgi:hypothetical protein